MSIRPIMRALAGLFFIVTLEAYSKDLGVADCERVLVRLTGPVETGGESDFQAFASKVYNPYADPDDHSDEGFKPKEFSKTHPVFYAEIPRRFSAARLMGQTWVVDRIKSQAGRVIEHRVKIVQDTPEDPMAFEVLLDENGKPNPDDEPALGEDEEGEPVETELIAMIFENHLGVRNAHRSLYHAANRSWPLRDLRPELEITCYFLRKYDRRGNLVSVRAQMFHEDLAPHGQQGQIGQNEITGRLPDPSEHGEMLSHRTLSAIAENDLNVEVELEAVPSITIENPASRRRTAVVESIQPETTHQIRRHPIITEALPRIEWQAPTTGARVTIDFWAPPGAVENYAELFKNFRDTESIPNPNTMAQGLTLAHHRWAHGPKSFYYFETAPIIRIEWEDQVLEMPPLSDLLAVPPELLERAGFQGKSEGRPIFFLLVRGYIDVESGRMELYHSHPMVDHHREVLHSIFGSQELYDAILDPVWAAIRSHLPLGESWRPDLHPEDVYLFSDPNESLRLRRTNLATLEIDHIQENFEGSPQWDDASLHEEGPIEMVRIDRSGSHREPYEFDFDDGQVLSPAVRAARRAYLSYGRSRRWDYWAPLWRVAFHNRTLDGWTHARRLDEAALYRILTKSIESGGSLSFLNNF